MKLSDAAKLRKVYVVSEAVRRGDETDLQLLLEKVCHDYHSVQKHQGHLELASYLVSAGATPEREMAFEASRGGHVSLIQTLIDGGLAQYLFVAAALGDTQAASNLIEKKATAVTETDS